MNLRRNGIGGMKAALLACAVLTGAGCNTLLSPLNALHAEVIFETDSPTIGAIKKSLAIRYTILQAHLDAGVIGLTQDGMIALRDGTSLVGEAKTEIAHLIEEDNKERAALYREIARANGRPDWESQFRFAFADRWISRAPEGWYFRNSSGTWIKKLRAPQPGQSATNTRLKSPA